MDFPPCNWYSSFDKQTVQKVKKVAILVCAAFVTGLICSSIWSFFDEIIAPLLFNSRIERRSETDLPKAVVEEGGKILYCRMKADDFRLPLPPGAQVVPPIVLSGGFDTVDGSVEVRFKDPTLVLISQYENSLTSNLKVGGSATVEVVPGGVKIHFHYFGDR